MIENIIKFEDIDVELDSKLVHKLIKEYGDNSVFMIYVSFFGQEPTYHLLSVHESCNSTTAIIDNHEFYYNFRLGTKIMPVIKKICKITYEHTD